MSQLVNKSLVIAENARGESRYHMLETIRQYGREKLSETAEVETLRCRHLNFYMTLAEDIEPRLKTAERIARKKQMEIELDNFRAALEWSLWEAKNEEAEKGMRLACALMKIWHYLGYYGEGRGWLERCLVRLADGGFSATALYARALYSAGYLANYQEDYASSRPMLGESVALYRRMVPLNPRGLAAALEMLAMAIANSAGDFSLPRSLTDESVMLCRALGPEGMWDLAEALYWNGHQAFLQGNYETARIEAEESRALFRQTGDLWEAAAPIGTLGHIASNQKDYTTARAFYIESLRLRREVEDSYGVAAVTCWLAVMDYMLGKYEAAGKGYQESLNMWQDMGNKEQIAYNLLLLGIAALQLNQFEHAALRLKESLPLQKLLNAKLDKEFGTAWNLAGLSALARTQKQFVRAARLLGAAEAITASTEVLFFNGVSVAYIDIYESLIAAGHEHMDEAAWLEGRAMPLEQVIEYALKDGND
jgi:tetratricopeptide (TPR) repeat protein